MTPKRSDLVLATNILHNKQRLWATSSRGHKKNSSACSTKIPTWQSVCKEVICVRHQNTHMVISMGNNVCGTKTTTQQSACKEVICVQHQNTHMVISMENNVCGTKTPTRQSACKEVICMQHQNTHMAITK